MNRHFCFRLAFTFGLLITQRSAIAQTVKADYAKEYNFGALKRFAWQENKLFTVRDADENKLLDRKIMRSVSQNLVAKGIVEDATNPDFYIYYQAGIIDEASQVGSSPTAAGTIQPQTANTQPPTPWAAGGGSSAGFAPSVWYSLEGQVVFYVVDSKTKSVIWQSRATKKWHDVPKARKNEDKEINQIVEKSFKRFPPKQQN